MSEGGRSFVDDSLDDDNNVDHLLPFNLGASSPSKEFRRKKRKVMITVHASSAAVGRHTRLSRVLFSLLDTNLLSVMHGIPPSLHCWLQGTRIQVINRKRRLYGFDTRDDFDTCDESDGLHYNDKLDGFIRS